MTGELVGRTPCTENSTPQQPVPCASAAEYSDPLTIELLQLATLLMRCHTAKLGAQSHYRQQLLKFG